MAVKALKPAPRPSGRDGQGHGGYGRGGMKADRRSGERQRHNRNDRPAKPQYQPKRADGSVPGEARGPKRNPLRDGGPAQSQGKPRFRGRGGRPGGNAPRAAIGTR